MKQCVLQEKHCMYFSRGLQNEGLSSMWMSTLGLFSLLEPSHLLDQ